MGWVYRRLTHRERLRLACVATSRRVRNLPGGFLCFGTNLAHFLWGELRFQCKNRVFLFEAFIVDGEKTASYFLSVMHSFIWVF